MKLTVRELRRQKGWTQRELAERLGVSPGAVANWEVGTRTPSLETALRLAALFDVAVEDIRFLREGAHSSQATRSA